MEHTKTVRLIVVGVSTGVLHLRLKTDPLMESGINASIAWGASGLEPTFHGWALGDEVELTLRNTSPKVAE